MDVLDSRIPSIKPVEEKTVALYTYRKSGSLEEEFISEKCRVVTVFNTSALIFNHFSPISMSN